MIIALIIEGETEKAFVPHIRTFLKSRISGSMPRLQPLTCTGRIPKGDKLKRKVDLLLNDRPTPADYVVALTDVYTGTNPPDFLNAEDAKSKMRDWVGPNDRFFPHAAQYEFEAWLLPFWSDIQKRSGHNRKSPGDSPEQINHGNPPSQRIIDMFRSGSRCYRYVKPRDAGRILDGKDLAVAARTCPELKAFLNTLLTLSGATAIP